MAVPMFITRPSETPGRQVLWQIPQARREGWMCQHCGAEKRWGAQLSVCKGCKVDFYCKATSCQEADWARHKSSCTSIQAQEEVSAERRAYAALRSWRKKHAPTVNMYAVRAMNVLVDPSVGDRGVFVVLMRLRPAERRPEFLFDVDDAFPLPFSELGQNRAGIEKLYEEEKRAMEGREEKMMGVVLVIYFVTNMNVSLATPLVFHAPARLDMSGLAWKEQLLEHLNTGNLNLQSEAIGEVPST